MAVKFYKASRCQMEFCKIFFSQHKHKNKASTLPTVVRRNKSSSRYSSSHLRPATSSGEVFISWFYAVHCHCLTWKRYCSVCISFSSAFCSRKVHRKRLSVPEVCQSRATWQEELFPQTPHEPRDRRLWECWPTPHYIQYVPYTIWYIV